MNGLRNIILNREIRKNSKNRKKTNNYQKLKYDKFNLKLESFVSI